MGLLVITRLAYYTEAAILGSPLSFEIPASKILVGAVVPSTNWLFS
jgi:hypothetical protein